MHVLENTTVLHGYVKDLLLSELKAAPHGIHVLPTGKTFVQAYALLCEELQITFQEEQGTESSKDAEAVTLNFSGLRLINLDEYLYMWRVIAPQDPRSFRSYMAPLVQALMLHGFNPKNHIFPDTPYGFDYTFTRYELLTLFDEFVASLEQASSLFLGLGPPASPHVAFASPMYSSEIGRHRNEIGAFVSPVDSATKIANKNDSGIKGTNVPEYATTISPKTLLALRPKNVYLVAFGNKDLRPLLSFKAGAEQNRAEIDVNQYPPAVLFLLQEQGSTIHIVTDWATWNTATH